MAGRSLARLRNIGIVAHINAGKTTLTERFLFRSGKQSYMGEVDAGTATMDFMPQERDRGISISAAVTNIDWRGFHLNLIDTPGHVDFTAEVERSLLVLDGVIVVIDGVAGVESQTEIVWRQVQAHGVPAVVFINKLDRATADFEDSLISVAERLGCGAVPLVLPCREDGKLTGLIDLVEDKVIGGAAVDPATWRPSRQAIIEAVADRDEAILQDFVDGAEVGADRLHRAVRDAVLAGSIVPVLAGSALLNRGVDWLLTAVCRYLPSPLDRQITSADGVVIQPDEAAPFCGLVFKVQFDGDECLYFVRVYAGVLRYGDAVQGSRRSEPVTIGSIQHLHAAHLEEVGEVRAGDVAAVQADAPLVTGETLFARGHPVLLEAAEFPAPVVTARIEVAGAGDFGPMTEAARRLCREDPTLVLGEDEDSGTVLVSGMGELHLKVFEERLAAELGGRVRLSAPRVLLRETLARPASARAECRRHLDGQEIRTEVELRAEPRPGLGPARVGRIAPDLEVHVRRMLHRLLLAQLRAGLDAPTPAHDLEVEVVAARGELDGPRSEAVCGEALAIACRKIAATGGVVILEPYVDCEVSCPADTLSGALSDLRSRGVEVSEVSTAEGKAGVRGVLPLARVLGYATRLRSLTRGLGTVHLRPVGMRPVRT